jgi:hypothetical protein
MAPERQRQQGRKAMHVAVLAAHLAPVAAGNGFKAGPWLAIPILIVLAIIAIPIYIMRTRKHG